jgi:hypothetical protein
MVTMAETPTNPEGDEELSDAEIAKRRDEGLLRLLKMKPKPHSEIAGKKKPERTNRSSGDRRG